MSIDIEKVENLTGIVDKIIELQHANNNLDDNLIDDLIKNALFLCQVPFTEEEIQECKKNIACKYQIYALPGCGIRNDYDQENWYDDAKAEIEPVFWSRYKNYLIDTKHFSPNIVSTLGEETLDRDLMNYLLNPKDSYDQPVLRRGLIIGDVQSGKTSTYIGLMAKAADAGYKVFILLTGTIESLRVQTQERVEEGIIGIDMSAESNGKRVGVGLDNKPIRAMALTSRAKDFTGDANKIAVALSDKNAVIFVIKKQKNVLMKLKDWLVSLNADPQTGKIDLPMLLIDDEADNASINTSKDKEDPTTINRLIRELINVFSVANYVGFTATPFANVFIDPETTEKMEIQDLFPEDFIYALPTPSDYIGPTSIFSKSGQYHNQLEYITDAGREEDDGFSFYFKHKKEWEGTLPSSLTDAIYTFYLANAIRDLKGDITVHRSMLINISRFIKVQKYTKAQVEEIHTQAYRSIKYNLSNNFEESMRDPVLFRIYKNWEKQYSSCEFTWDNIVSVLFSSIENIKIKIVNSSKSSDKLIYPKKESLRVIAIGGLALSRGLTLEGLIISYFYRNTCTYDVLMQMGRWFGYRQNYKDLFRIWTYKDSADWYAEIAEATEQLKTDMAIMNDNKLKPRDFGIRVRNNSRELNITAPNKMRNAKDEYEFSSYYGGFVETPYLEYSASALKHNFLIIQNLVGELLQQGYSFERQPLSVGQGHYIIQRIPKAKIVEFIRNLKISKFSSNFNTKQLSDFIESSTNPAIKFFDIAFMEGNKTTDPNKIVDFYGRQIYKSERTCEISTSGERINIGSRGKLSGPTDGQTGIVETNGVSAVSIIEAAKESYKTFYRKKYGVDFNKRTYPSTTWFEFVENRRPILLIYLVDIKIDKDRPITDKIKSFKAEMGTVPLPAFTLGFPRSDKYAHMSGTKFKANKIYNWFEIDEFSNEAEEEE